MNDTLVLDLETSIKNRDGDNKPIIGNNRATPHWPDNQIVLSMWAYLGEPVQTQWYGAPKAPTTPTTIVGHNIKFDLLYLLRLEDWQQAWDTGLIKVFDTQLAEYIISGQTHLYPSLDDCSIKYGGSVKDDRIKNFWNSGVDTEDIPKDMLLDYGIHDVKNTEIVYLAQREEIDKLGLNALVRTQMAALVATTEMERNGMAFDKDVASAKATELVKEQQELEGELLSGWNTPFTPNIGSNQHIGAYLFGGDITYDGVEDVLDDDGQPMVYKSGARKGEVKTRKCKLTHTMPRQYTPHPKWLRKTGWAVDDAVLATLSKKSEWAGKLRRWRELAKDIGTYFIGYSELVFPDGCLHGNLNHCSTGTGRLSSTNPNLQNVSKG